jgi:hypothetical protein
MLNRPAFQRTFRKYLRIIFGRFLNYRFVSFFYGRTRFLSLRPKLRTEIEKLDEILKSADTLQQFLGDRTLINQYYQGLSKYFGESKFPRRSFDAILNQLAEVAEKVPGVGLQVWSNQYPKDMSFDLVTVGSASGRAVNLNLWKLYRFDWLTHLKRTFEKAFPEAESQVIEQKMKVYFSEVQLNLKVLEMNLMMAMSRDSNNEMRATISKKEARFISANYYKQILSDSELEIYASHLLYRYLTSYENRFFFQLDDADLIIDYFKELRQNLDKIADFFPNITLPPPVLTKLKKLIPAPNVLLSDKKMFPELIDKSNIQVRRHAHAQYRTKLIRPFHGLWLGIVSNDCLAGDPTTLDLLTPARWSVSALEGVRTMVIEKNGIYCGFARVIPLEYERREIYGSLEVWASAFNNRFIFVDPEDGSKHTMSFFEQWYPKFLKMLPAHWRGVVVSESNHIDNIGAKKAIYNSEYWKQGAKLCHSSSLGHIDVLAMELSQVVKPIGRALEYCNEMVFDAKIADAGNIRVLSRARKYSDAKVIQLPEKQSVKFRDLTSNI